MYIVSKSSKNLMAKAYLNVKKLQDLGKISLMEKNIHHVLNTLDHQEICMMN